MRPHRRPEHRPASKSRSSSAMCRYSAASSWFSKTSRLGMAIEFSLWPRQLWRLRHHHYRRAPTVFLSGCVSVRNSQPRAHDPNKLALIVLLHRGHRTRSSGVDGEPPPPPCCCAIAKRCIEQTGRTSAEAKLSFANRSEALRNSRIRRRRRCKTRL